MTWLLRFFFVMVCVLVAQVVGSCVRHHVADHVYFACSVAVALIVGISAIQLADLLGRDARW